MKFKKQTITLIICVLAMFAIYGCSIPIFTGSASKAQSIPYTAFANKVSTTDQILQSLIASMEKNENSCQLLITDESLIDAESWMNTLPGIDQIHCEYRKVKDGFNAVVSFAYWDNYAIVNAHKTQNLSHLNARQTELYGKYIQVLNDYTSPFNSDCANELAIHDYLVTHIEYEEQEDTIYNAYDAMIKGKSVCSGYTEAFKTFMDLLGIENTTISGTAGNQQHIWNAVKLDNEWYHVDVTWDDPVGSPGTDVDHAYFNITDNDMAIDHTWDLGQSNGLTANGTKYSYPEYAGLVNISSQSQLDSYIAERINNRSTYIEFTSNSILDLKSAITASDTTLSYSYRIVERVPYSLYLITLNY
ncbi:MAG: transglutaminase domain-containing protein [Eubacteriales bacterium]|nr:transglutaminase domain-containing protein [Eubacteriales bacterium]